MISSCPGKEWHSSEGKLTSRLEVQCGLNDFLEHCNGKIRHLATIDTDEIRSGVSGDRLRSPIREEGWQIRQIEIISPRDCQTPVRLVARKWV